MKNLCIKLKKEIDRALESLRDTPFEVLNNKHKALKQNILMLKSKGIIIVSLNEYKKLVLAELTLNEAIKRGYGLPLPKETKRTSQGALSVRKGGCQSCQKRTGRWLSLVRI